MSKTSKTIPEDISLEVVKWNRECRTDIRELFHCPNPDYISLFSNDSDVARNLIVIRSPNGNPFVRISCLENNYFDINVNMSIIKALKPDNEMNAYRSEFVN